MSQLKVNTIRHTGASSDAVTLASDGTCTAKITNQPPGNRNLIINGSFQCSQRGSSFTTGTGNFSIYTLDRWKIATYATDQLNLTVTQEPMNQAVPGFKNYIKVSPNAAESALASDEYTNLRHSIEAQDLQQICYGTSSAKSLTLSFWVKSNTTGTAGITLKKDDATAYYITRTYTINAADTWEKKTVTIPGLTPSGIANDNGVGLHIYWFLSAGSDYTSTDSTSWVTTGDSKYAYGHAINLTDSTSDYLALAGVQLEVGDVATDFEHRSYGDELARCQRYYEHSYNTGVAVGSNSNVGGYYQNITSDSGGNAVWTVEYKVQKRAVPTMTFYRDNGTSGSWDFNGESVSAGTQTVNGHRSSQTHLNAYMAIGANWDPCFVYGHWTSSAEI